MSQYTLLTSKYEGESENDLFQIGDTIRKTLHANLISLANNPEKLESTIDIKILFYNPIFAQLPRSNMQRIPEFDSYSMVWFLNEAAIQLCEENQISLKELKKIEKTDLPEHLGLEMDMPYLPKSKR